MDADVIVSLLAAGFAVIVAAYIVSILIHKRMMDSVQATASATLVATQSLISLHTYYGAYERAEFLRTIASVIGIDQVRDTALQFQQNRMEPPTVIQYQVSPPQQQKQGP